MRAARFPRVPVLPSAANLGEGETALSTPGPGTQSGCSAHLGPCAAGRLWAGHVPGTAREAGSAPLCLASPGPQAPVWLSSAESLFGKNHKAY